MDKGLQQPGGGPREDLISPGPRQEKWVGEALQAEGTERLEVGLGAFLPGELHGQKSLDGV